MKFAYVNVLLASAFAFAAAGDADAGAAPPEARGRLLRTAAAAANRLPHDLPQGVAVPVADDVAAQARAVTDAVQVQGVAVAAQGQDFPQEPAMTAVELATVLADDAESVTVVARGVISHPFLRSGPHGNTCTGPEACTDYTLPPERSDSCNGDHACYRVRSGTDIGNESCNGGGARGACKNAHGNVGNGSCNGADACPMLGWCQDFPYIGRNFWGVPCSADRDTTVGNNSCNGAMACSAGKNGSPMLWSVGDESCNGNNACRDMRGGVGDKSCDRDDACRDYHGGDIPDNCPTKEDFLNGHCDGSATIRCGDSVQITNQYVGAEFSADESLTAYVETDYEYDRDMTFDVETQSQPNRDNFYGRWRISCPSGVTGTLRFMDGVRLLNSSEGGGALSCAGNAVKTRMDYTSPASTWTVYPAVGSSPGPVKTTSIVRLACQGRFLNTRGRSAHGGLKVTRESSTYGDSGSNTWKFD